MSSSNTPGFGAPETAELLRWWHGLTSDRASGGARADRAVLRRASDLQAVVLTPAYQRIHAQLRAVHGEPRWQAHEQDRVAAIVGLAAHVDTINTHSLPQAMSTRREGSDRNPVSELRFKRLLEAADVDALFVGLRRALPLIGYSVDLKSLATDVFYWGNAVKKRWAYGYDWSQKA